MYFMKDILLLRFNGGGLWGNLVYGNDSDDDDYDVIEVILVGCVVLFFVFRLGMKLLLLV